MRLKVDVQRAAAGLLSGLFKREYFGMLHACIGKGPSTYEVALRIDDDSANVWIRRSKPKALARQVKRAAQKLLVG
jgi:hypothetical protein